MHIEDGSRDAQCLADDIRKRAPQRTVARFSFIFSVEKLNQAARALMNSGLRLMCVDETGAVLIIEAPSHRLTDAVAICLAYDGRYLSPVASPS